MQFFGRLRDWAVLQDYPALKCRLLSRCPYPGAHGEFPLGTLNDTSTCAPVSIPRFEPPKFHYLISLSHQHHINHIDEEPVLDHAGHIAEGVCQCGWVGNLAETTIQDARSTCPVWATIAGRAVATMV